MLLLLSLLTLRTPEDDWQQLLDRIAPRVARLNVATSPEPSVRAFKHALTSLGYRSSSADHDDTGLDLPVVEGLAPMANSNGFVALLGSGGKRGVPKGACLARFGVRGGRSFAEVVELSESVEDLALPQDAAICSGHLLVAGSAIWYGNAPRAEVTSYSRRGKVWHVAASLASEQETWWNLSFHFSKGRSTPDPIEFQTRTYPKYLSASHATAQLTHLVRWSFRNGIPRLEWSRLASSPYNTLDHLYGSLDDRDWKTVRSLCASDRVARAVWKLRSKTSEGFPNVYFPGGTSDPASRTIGIENLKSNFHFVRVGKRYVVSRVTPS